MRSSWNRSLRPKARIEHNLVKQLDDRSKSPPSEPATEADREAVVDSFCSARGDGKADACEYREYGQGVEKEHDHRLGVVTFHSSKFARELSGRLQVWKAISWDGLLD